MPRCGHCKRLILPGESSTETTVVNSTGAPEIQWASHVACNQLASTFEKLTSMLVVPVDWDHEGSFPPSKALVASVKKLIVATASLGVNAQFIAPNANAGLYLRYDYGCKELHLELEGKHMQYLKVLKLSSGNESTEEKRVLISKAKFKSLLEWLVN